MDTLMSIFGNMLCYTYHCFDRIVINGYLSMLNRAENVVAFFHTVVGEPCITKEVLAAPTQRYTKWVESFAQNHGISMEWAEKGVRKEDLVRPYLHAMQRRQGFGVYFILKSMEQSATFRSVQPKYPTSDPNYRILAKQRSRFTHYYFYIHDEELGAMVIRVGSFLPFQVTAYLNGHHFMEQQLLRSGVSFRKEDNAFLGVDDPDALQKAAYQLTPDVIQDRLDFWISQVGPQFSEEECSGMNLRRFYAISQIEYCHNFIFRRNNPIRRLFQRSCELGLLSLSADKLSQIFGCRVTRAFKGKLQTVLERVDQGHHIFRAYFKNSFVKQYEKFRTFLRMEVCSNFLPDLHIKKSLANLPLVRDAAREIIDRFAGFQAYAFNVHFDFPLLQRIALPVTSVHTRIAGIKIHDTRLIRLMETFLHSGICIQGWTAAFLHEHIVNAYELPDYTINQLRYDLRKMIAHGLVRRNGKHYSYLLTDKGQKVAILFTLFHKRLSGPIANSLFDHPVHPPGLQNDKLEHAYRNADQAIQHIIDLLAA
jgi:hypothetical protein